MTDTGVIIANPDFYPASQYHAEDYFRGFIAGLMHASNPDCALEESSICLDTQVAVVQAMSDRAYTLLSSDLQQRDRLDWSFNNEYNKIFVVLLEILVGSTAIDNDCNISTFIDQVRNLTNVKAVPIPVYVAHLNSNGFDLLLYFFYFIGGIVWMDRFVVAYAVGTFIKILTMTTITYTGVNVVTCV